MEREKRLTILRVVGVFTVLLAVINAGATLAVFGGGGGPPQVQPDESGANAPGAESEVVQDVGGLTSPMGIAILFWSAVLLVIGIGLIAHRSWEMFAMLALGGDAALKAANIISQLVIGQGLGDAFVPVIFIVVDAAAIYALFVAWNARRNLYPQQPGGQRNAKQNV